MEKTNTTDILDRGMACLFRNLGIIETERFISTLMRERFDYTEWRRTYFADAAVDELLDKAAAYDRDNPIKR